MRVASAKPIGISEGYKSVKRTLTNTFLTVAGMQLIAAGTCWATRGLVKMNPGQLILLLVIELGLLVAVYAQRTRAWGLVPLALFAAVTGVGLTPMLTAAMSTPEYAEAVWNALALTVASTLGVSAYAIVSKRDFSYLSAFLFGALLVLLSSSVINLFIKSSWLNLMLGAAGALVFLLYLLFDISKIVTGKERNYIVAAINVYLDILNLFLSILRWRSSN